MQALLCAFLFGQLPGLVLINVCVYAVGQRHDFAHHFAEFALGIQRGDGGQRIAQLGKQLRAVCRQGAQLAIKALVDEACRARSDVDVFADQVGIDAQHEVFGVEVDVFVFGRKLGGQVVAQPFGVHLQVQVLERIQPRAAALAHLLAVVDGEKAMHEHVVWHLAAAELEQRRPEQGVERDDVFADEVVLLQIGLGHVGFVVLPAFFEQVLEAGQVANGRIQPDVEVFAWRVGDFDAEIGRIAADVPIVELGLAVFVLPKPFAYLVGNLGLQAAILRPLLKKLYAARVGEPEEKMLAAFEFGPGARQGRIRLDQFGGRVHRAAHFAVVAILVFGMAIGALALDEAVG